MQKRYLITAALPYANGPLHLGHIAGVDLPADIFHRHLTLLGTENLFICGSDEHGVAITLAAEKAGIDYQSYVDKYFVQHKETFAQLGIEFDYYSRTHSSTHSKNAQRFFKELVEKGLIEQQIEMQLFCNNCQKFLADRYVRGDCPHCGTQGVRGDECTSCGQWLRAEELRNPQCAICGATPEKKPTEQWFFKLDQLEDKLRTWLQGNAHWKRNVIEMANGFLAGGLKARPITRDLPWGVPIPGSDKKVLYVWFEAPIGYISITEEYLASVGRLDDLDKYWRDPQTRIIHFIGKDNIVFHSIMWPATLMATDDQWNLPFDIPGNDFLNLEGRKFSKSEGWDVDLDNLIKTYGTTPIRYFLATIIPETGDSNFTWRGFMLANNSELADIIGNLVNRTIVFSDRYLNGRVLPSTATALSPATQEALRQSYELFLQSFDKMRLREALRAAVDAARFGNRYFDEQKPWELRKVDMQRCEQAIHECFCIIKQVGVLLRPFLPELSSQIFAALGFDQQVLDKKTTYDQLLALDFQPDQKVKAGSILIKKIDKAVIEEEEAKLRI